MPQFVILRHDGPRGVHFDFMLEAGDVLKTWALPQSPLPGIEMTCDAIGDHRVAYLDYEGPLSGERGSVTRWDRGSYLVEHQSDTEWIVFLEGDKLLGEVQLRRMPDESNRWRFLLRPKTDAGDTRHAL